MDGADNSAVSAARRTRLLVPVHDHRRRRRPGRRERSSSASHAQASASTTSTSRQPPNTGRFPQSSKEHPPRLKKKHPATEQKNGVQCRPRTDPARPAPSEHTWQRGDLRRYRVFRQDGRRVGLGRCQLRWPRGWPRSNRMVAPTPTSPRPTQPNSASNSSTLDELLERAEPRFRSTCRRPGNEEGLVGAGSARARRRRASSSTPRAAGSSTRRRTGRCRQLRARPGRRTRRVRDRTGPRQSAVRAAGCRYPAPRLDHRGAGTDVTKSVLAGRRVRPDAVPAGRSGREVAPSFQNEFVSIGACAKELPCVSAIEVLGELSAEQVDVLKLSALRGGSRRSSRIR